MNEAKKNFAPEEEGVRTIVREPEMSSDSPSREKIDVRKMIVYSEILKPKFQ